MIIETCNRCNRKLKTSKSIHVGMGPVCKRKQAEADAEFEKRQVTIYEVLEYTEKSKR
ncbi:DUF6011 domain-containing protein [Paenisporosarcina sp. TG-14]|uniref:DUF6011 domain-containing protein n=1 Tax=Paenisporosarcina sp. TG-14 TaxID=1231057 RepID=UPI0002D6065A|nr:DUF6011 domain-containing protein [Paenisporosarcina sp. TG-14]